MKPRLLDLFAGIGGFSLALERCGCETVAFSEVDPFACRVLAHHWPMVPNLGDVTTLRGSDIVADVVTAGFPCQDLSVAGKRGGLKGERSGLFWQIIRIVREMQEAGRGPTFVVLENVPGLFSSHRGRDFASVLRGLAELRPLDIAWRVLDAQFFGVPQRRRRVFVVADFRGERASEILSLTEGVRGHSAACGEAREDAANTLGGGSGSRGWCSDTDRMTFVPTHALTRRCAAAEEDGTGRGSPLVVNLRGREGGAQAECDPEGLPNLRGASGGSSRSMVVAPEPMLVAFSQESDGSSLRNATPQARPITGRHGDPGVVASNTFGVRRLSPQECERLQGFPDDFTAIPGAADGPRYRALGNSIAIPVVEWIGARLLRHLAPS